MGSPAAVGEGRFNDDSWGRRARRWDMGQHGRQWEAGVRDGRQEAGALRASFRGRVGADERQGLQAGVLSSMDRTARELGF
jgi:hypothetical protein